MKIKYIIPFLLISSAFADSRIQFVPYDKSKVYTVNTRTGQASLIQFQDGEYVDQEKTDKSVLALGQGDAWTLGVRQNNFVLKPKRDLPDTNLIIVTNKRTYAFDLKMAKQIKIPTTYVLAFNYPDDEKAKDDLMKAEIMRMIAASEAEKAKKLAALEEIKAITAPARAKTININTEYYYRGESVDLVPTAAWDDGRFTYLQYNHAGSLPQFYKIMPDGTEALLNSNVNTDSGRQNEIVLHEINRMIIARLGNQVIEITNKGYKLPEFNDTGTSVHGAVRVQNKVEGVE